MTEFRYDTQLLIEGEDLDEDVIHDYFTEHFKGDCLLAVGDEEVVKIHFHTNEPWKVLEYCASLGEIYDIVVEDMIRQERGLRAKARRLLKSKKDSGIRLCVRKAESRSFIMQICSCFLCRRQNARIDVIGGILGVLCSFFGKKPESTSLPRKAPANVLDYLGLKLLRCRRRFRRL